MGNFVAWMRAKLMASTSKSGAERRRGAVLVEYLLLVMGIFGIAGLITAYWTQVGVEYTELTASVAAIAP